MTMLPEGMAVSRTCVLGCARSIENIQVNDRGTGDSDSRSGQAQLTNGLFERQLPECVRTNTTKSDSVLLILSEEVAHLLKHELCDLS